MLFNVISFAGSKRYLLLPAKDIFYQYQKKLAKFGLQSGTIVTLLDEEWLEVPEGVMDILKAYYHTPQQPMAQPWAIG